MYNTYPRHARLLQLELHGEFYVGSGHSPEQRATELATTQVQVLAATNENDSQFDTPQSKHE